MFLGINDMFQVKSGKYETTSTARALSPSNISWDFAANFENDARDDRDQSELRTEIDM